MYETNKDRTSARQNWLRSVMLGIQLYNKSAKLLSVN